MDYSVTIDQFEGPLDLLLHLVKDSKMDIFDIKIDLITTQYLDYIEKMEQLNLDIASNYLVMASELIEMKSKLLLPKKEEEIEEEDPKENLINRLIEYQQYKEISRVLKEKENLRKEIYTKLPESISIYREEVVVSEEVSLDDLVSAFEKFLKRQKEAAPLLTKVTTKELSVEERRVGIKRLLKEKGRVLFTDLFESFDKGYVVVTFLAILEMARKNELFITQDKRFSEIVCEVR